MRAPLLTLLLLAGLARAESFPAGTADATGSDDLLLRDVRVLAMDGSAPQDRRDVRIQAGRIRSIEPHDATATSPAAQVIEGRGRLLIPGLVEMHAHVPPADSPKLQAVLDLFLANGVTTLRGVLGEPGHLGLRDAIARGERIAPRLYTSGPSLNGTSVADADAAVRMVEAQKRAGYDLLKLHPGLDRVRHDAIVATARRVGIPVAGHVSEAVGLEHALRTGGMGTIEHLDDYVRALVPTGAPEREASPGFFGVDAALAADPERIGVLVETTRAADVFVVPTETLMVHLLGDLSEEDLARREEMVYVEPATLKQWQENRIQLRAEVGPEKAERFLDLRRRLIRALHAEGRVILGSDAPQMFNVPGFSLHRELQLMVDAGIEPADALRIGSAAAADWLGAGERRGRVLPGYDADLLLLDADPLVDIRNSRSIVGVVLAGRWLDRAELDRRLAAARPAVME